MMKQREEYNTLFMQDYKNDLYSIDFGRAKVGIAKYEPMTSQIVPITTIRGNSKTILSQLIKFLIERKASDLVVGLPTSDDSSENDACAKIRSFCRRIERRISIKIYYQDEYLSSHEATELRAFYPDSVTEDEIAAIIILKRFINCTC
jgi:putative holliday junction resolvase